MECDIFIEMTPEKIKSLGIKDDLTGRRFGRLLVICPHDKRNRAWRWTCHCDCGKETIGIGAKMKQGFKRSCGCFKAKNVRPKYGNKHHGWKGYEKISASRWKQMLASAKIRHIPFKITIKTAWELYNTQNRKCALTGVDIDFGPENVPWRKHEGTASLDRIDSDKPYEVGNVQWVHKDVNYMKQWFDQQHFFTLCKQVVEYNKL